jgi:hypothetical protein
MVFDPLEPRRGGLIIAAPTYVHLPNPGGVACLGPRCGKSLIIGFAAQQTGHPYGVKRNVTVGGARFYKQATPTGLETKGASK